MKCSKCGDNFLPLHDGDVFCPVCSIIDSKDSNGKVNVQVEIPCESEDGEMTYEEALAWLDESGKKIFYRHLFERVEDARDDAKRILEELEEVDQNAIIYCSAMIALAGHVKWCRANVTYSIDIGHYAIYTLKRFRIVADDGDALFADLLFADFDLDKYVDWESFCLNDSCEEPDF